MVMVGNCLGARDLWGTRLRRSLMNEWRSDRPTLRSERPRKKKSRFMMRWELGLAGIAAESEDPNWAVSLTNQEVSLAIRYVLLVTEGLPDWLNFAQSY